MLAAKKNIPMVIKVPKSTYHMAWTDTGLKTCIRPAVLMLNPLRMKNKKRKEAR